MKILISFLLVPILSIGQTKTVETTLRNGSIALGSWSVINMATAASLVKNADGEMLHFHQMNGYWNIVNGSLAAYSLLSPLVLRSKTLSQVDLAKRYQKIFLINAGLDVVYITSGGFLTISVAPKMLKEIKVLGPVLFCRVVFYLFTIFGWLT